MHSLVKGWSFVCALSIGGVVGYKAGSSKVPQSVRSDTLAPAPLASQKAWLRSVIFPHAPLPPSPSQMERVVVRRDLATEELRPPEARVVNHVLQRDIELLVWLRRDLDGDGMRDFLLSVDDGKFFEGDPDIDGDGVLNAADEQPYDPLFGGIDLDGDQFPDKDFRDINRNDVPDRVDWALLSDPRLRGRALSQQKMLRDFKILLIDRGAHFSQATIDALEDCLKLVFSAEFTIGAGIPTLRTVVAEPQVYLSSNLDDHTHGLMLSHSQSLVVYQSTLDAPAHVQLGLLVHEIGHALQYQWDVDPERSWRQLRGYPVEPSPFLEIAGLFGWTQSELRVVESPASDWFLPVYDDGPSPYLLQDIPVAEWQRWMDAIFEEVGEGFMQDPRVRRRHIIGDYSLSDPLEHYSDHLMAHVYLAIEGAARLMVPSTKSYQRLLSRFRAQVQASWPYFAYENAAGGRALELIRKRHPLEPENMRRLAQKYFEISPDTAAVLSGNRSLTLQKAAQF